jgi:hypothetical protein
MTKPAHITKGGVLGDLDLSRSEASVLKIKAAIVEAILAEIDRSGFTQREFIEVSTNANHPCRHRHSAKPLPNRWIANHSRPIPLNHSCSATQG